MGDEAYEQRAIYARNATSMEYLLDKCERHLREALAAERKLDEAASVLGAVVTVGALKPGDVATTLENHPHAAVQVAMRLRAERDAAIGEVDTLRDVLSTIVYWHDQ